MNSYPSTATASSASGVLLPRAEFCRVLAWAVTSLFAVVAVVLLARRLTDALAQPLPTFGLVASGIVVVASAISIRMLDRQAATKWLLSVVLLLFAFSITLPGSSWLGLTVLWLAVVGEEIWTWQPRHERPPNHINVAWRHAVDSPDLPQLQQAAPTLSLSLVDETADAVEPSTNKSEPADWTNSKFTQQLNYSRDGEGLSIEGWARAEFTAGQRTATLHTAFCPAFSRAPQVDSEPLDGPDCEIHPTLTLPWGVRWEVKLNRAAKEPTSVVLGFFASESET
jgi:hypothetical protein